MARLYSINHNKRRLRLELMPQPDPELWHKWVYEIRQILTEFNLMTGDYPQRASREKRIDQLRRYFDSHGSNLNEAIEAAEDDLEYWDRLCSHPGGSKADHIPFESASKVFAELQEQPGYNRNTYKYYRGVPYAIR